MLFEPAHFQEDALRGVDMNEHLKLYHTKDDRLKGLIFDHQNQLVVQNFPIPVEFVLPRDQNVLLERIQFPVIAYESIEGTILRVYYYKEDWQISTSSRLDAFSSFWANTNSFGRQFAEWVEQISGVPLDVFLCSLDREKAYYFLLPTVGLNRLGRVSHPNETMRIYLVALENRQTHELQFGLELSASEVNLWSLVPHRELSCADELWVWGEQMNLLFYQGRDVLRTQTEEYFRRCQLRNNEMNVKLRYIQLLSSGALDDCAELERMYTEVNFQVTIVLPLERAVRMLQREYFQRYVEKQDELQHLPKSMYVVIRKCHTRYLNTREATTPEVVREVILQQEPRHILNLLKHY
jgi:hypothetical protein